MFMFGPAICQHSSCLLILFAVTANDSKETCVFCHGNDTTLSFFLPSAFMHQTPPALDALS